MSRVVLDTNVVVSALLAPAGTEATVLMLAFTGHVTLYVSTPVLAEYDEVLRRPRLKLEPRKIDAAMAAIRRVAHLVAPVGTLAVSPDESDNRFLECAEAAGADWLVTGNTRHFPRRHKGTLIVTGRQFLDRMAGSGPNGSSAQR
jgi:putative PIN family toxin of toxin-antitoxin system